MKPNQLLPLFLLCLMLAFNLAFSQTNDYYFDINKKKITKRAYKAIERNVSEYLKLEFVTDTGTVHVVEKRELRGVLDKELRGKIIEYLNSVSNRKTDTSKTIVINYFPGMDDWLARPNIDLSGWYGEYVDQINAKRNVSNYFIYQTVKGTELFNKKIEWYPDSDKLFETNFFPLHYSFGSYLIIYPSGNYYLYKGEYDRRQILWKL